ncbi:MAG: histidine ammonia-lyase, partial [Ilumatobacteraceae bacterium]|nr:histidine ammonia-lyase [Ilumatobacteraceae bacterium]
MNNAPVLVNTSGLDRDSVINVARNNAEVKITQSALDALARSSKIVEDLAKSDQPVYGISTGFGALATKHIAPEDRIALQQSLIRSHAAGMGQVVEPEVVRAMQLLRLRTLCSGATGVRPVVAETIAAMLNASITPVVYEYGSLGCSGDLAPLSHCALAMMGEGEVFDKSANRRPALEVLKENNIKPIVLREKEGLALINGTDGMLGMLLLAITDLNELCTLADIATALSVEALLGTDQVFAPEMHEPLRAHPGQIASAANIFGLLKNSPLVASHREDDTRVQDAYSLRCAPQVNGAVRDTITHALNVAQRELAAMIDNPVITSSGEIRSNGNFHGAPIGYVLDFLAIAACDLGSMSERRTDRMLDTNRSMGLPAFLAFNAGVDSGLMIAQYTQASMVSENKRLAVPASVDSIPTSAMQEDHVSMGWSAGRKLRLVVNNLRRIVAIEILSATRALDMRQPLKSSPALTKVCAEVRKVVDSPGPDRILSEEMARVEILCASGQIR